MALLELANRSIKRMASRNNVSGVLCHKEVDLWLEGGERLSVFYHVAIACFKLHCRCSLLYDSRVAYCRTYPSVLIQFEPTTISAWVTMIYRGLTHAVSALVFI